MELSKQELKQKISDRIKDNDDLVIELLEDIEDSMLETNEQILDETREKELEDLKLRYEDLKAKYKDRFLTKIDENKENDNSSLEEEEIIDVKEI